jgi:hypothetical protein
MAGPLDGLDEVNDPFNNIDSHGPSMKVFGKEMFSPKSHPYPD